MGTQQKKKKRTKDNRAVVSEIKRTQNLDANRLALQPSFEGTAYATIGTGTISFCNVTASVVTSLQGVGTPAGDTTPPAQVTGLTVGSPTGSSLSLSWTASAAGDLDHYNVYRGTTAGFTVTPGSTTPMGSPASNSFVDTGLSTSTTYYYRVLAADTAGNLGTLSAEASGTTTATPSASPDLWLKLDNSLADASGNSNSTSVVSGFAYSTSSQFGSHCGELNYPTTTTREYINTVNSASTGLDLSTGFSLSFWFYAPSDHGQTNQSHLAEKYVDGNNLVAVVWNNTTNLVNVRLIKTGTSYRRKSNTTVTTNAWHHVVLTFNGSTNTIELYLDKVAGVTATESFSAASTTSNWIFGDLISASDTAQTFRGRLDEIQYFKGVVLTSTQVTNLFNTNAP